MLKGIITSNSLNDYEKEHQRASYKTIVERYIGDIVLCNKIMEIDGDSVYCNMDYLRIVHGDNPEIYQYYLCNISESVKNELIYYGLIISYSDLLECDVLCIDHYGTSWDYVLTECVIYDSWEQLEQANH